jgi:probable rRNA maturation factor
VVEGEMSRVGGTDIEVSFAFVAPHKIKELNAKWRKMDNVTDVLSFGQDDFLQRLTKKSLQPNEFLGEIVVCLAQVAKDAKELKKTFNQELSWVVVHGVLHLFGYDHEAKESEAVLMRQKEEEYLGKK